MSDPFDPYHVWLGIKPQDQPPHYYRLLGIDLFESNENVISMAADRQVLYLKQFQTGEYAMHAQRLLDEVAEARVCLLNKKDKAAYNDMLRNKFAPPFTPPSETPPPPGVILPRQPVPTGTRRKSHPSTRPLTTKKPIRIRADESPRYARERKTNVAGFAAAAVIVIVGLFAAWLLTRRPASSQDIGEVAHNNVGEDREGASSKSDGANDEDDGSPNFSDAPISLPESISDPSLSEKGEKQDAPKSPSESPSDPTLPPSPEPSTSPEIDEGGKLEVRIMEVRETIQEQMERRRDDALAIGDLQLALAQSAEVARAKGEDSLAAQIETLVAFREATEDLRSLWLVVEESRRLVEASLAAHRPETALSMAELGLVAARQADDPELVRRATQGVLRAQDPDQYKPAPRIVPPSFVPTPLMALDWNDLITSRATLLTEAQGEAFDKFFRVGRVDQYVETREKFSGPLAIFLVARTNGANIGINAFGDVQVIWSRGPNQSEMHFHAPGGGEILTARTTPLNANSWYRLLIVVTKRGVFIRNDNTVAMKHTNQKFNLGRAAPVRVTGSDGSVIDVKGLSVQQINPMPDVFDRLK